MTAPFNSPTQHRRISAAGGVPLPVIIVIAALAVSAAVFFFITRPSMKDEKAATAATPPPAAPVLTPVAPPKDTAKTTPQPKAVTKPAPPTPPPTFGFARPQDVGKEMLRSLASGDFEKAGKLAAASDPSQSESAAKVFENMVKDLGAKVGREDQLELLGQVENKTRLGVPLLLPGQDTPIRMHLDVERDERMGWKITRLHLPKELAAAVQTKDAPMTPTTPARAPAKTGATAPTSPAGKDAPRPAPKGPASITATKKAPLFSVSEHPDALSFASDFVRALLRHDFLTAHKFVDEKRVPAERLAGLCIVFEEGKYEFKPNKPMIITVANPEVSWVIAQVQSPSLEQSTEFGLELQRSGIDQPWKVVGLNLSEILGSFAASASKLGVPYTPIVTNPKGGESLALYFEYDKAQLHPRALKQLEIVAGLLKSDPKRRLQIAGHTDAKGTDDYNLQLSQARAEFVKTKLVSLGVPRDQVVTSGLGKAQPLGPNQKADGSDDPAGRSRNRRAEIFLDF